MKEKIVNHENLNESDINERIYRARGIILNSKGEMLLGYCNGTYQFPGGFLENGENLVQGLKREIKEETGIELEDKEISDLFYTVKYYNRDWPKEGTNRYTEMDYFKVTTDKLPNSKKMNLDDWEKEHNYISKYIKRKDFKNILKETLDDNPKNKIVYKDMIEAFDIMGNLRL